MSGQILDRVMRCYRIGDPGGAFPIFNWVGARLFPGRWNTPAAPVIYTSEHYSTAMLEKLVHGSGHLPPNQHYIEITLPNGISYEYLTPHQLPGWDDPAAIVSRAYGATWALERRSALLFVPSVVARVDYNILINPTHPDTARITYGLHQPVWWDERLWGGGRQPDQRPSSS